MTRFDAAVATGIIVFMITLVVNISSSLVDRIAGRRL